MRWRIIRLIFMRELRDQLRDRRTIFMIAVLPLFLYPVLGLVLAEFAGGMADKPSNIGIAGSDHLPQLGPTSYKFSPLPAAAFFAQTPQDTILGPRLDLALGAAALTQAAFIKPEYPPLLVNGRIHRTYFGSVRESKSVQVELLESKDRAALESKQVDVILTVPADLLAGFEDGTQPILQLDYREDERSRSAHRRLLDVLAFWKKQLREVRWLRLGKPADYDNPYLVNESAKEKPPDAIATEELVGLMVRIFPFLLVMWSLAGALYPAVDLCAGEKERGTMETLLISPASREEIVLGKFLTICLFSAATALLNLASMALTASRFSSLLTHEALRPASFLWCVLLVVPLSAFFSAICLAVGAYARSTKEGQYYLMPLFLLTMPLVFLTLAPGVELNAFYSLVPVTGVALLMQRLMTSPLDKVPWEFFLPVFLPIVLYSWLAMRWAIEQFNSEEVLFREAERLDLGLWLKRLLREKETLPSTGQALFCFALLVTLRWISFGAGDQQRLVVNTAVGYLAFVATPPLLMVLLLTTRPLQGLALRVPSFRMLLTAALLAGLLLPPLAQLTFTILQQFPRIKELLSEKQPLIQELVSLGEEGETPGWQYLVVFALMPAICEELAFRGFILTGLLRRFRPWRAIIICSVLFALFHMNVFQALPSFLIGVVLSLLAVRSGSVLPGMLFHLLHDGLLIGGALLLKSRYSEGTERLQEFFQPAVTAILSACALALLVRLGYRLPDRTDAQTMPTA
jgi:sodium transport system permease protein